MKYGAKDVTYLIYKVSRAYLSIIIDLYDRYVVSYKIYKNNNILVIDFNYTSYEYKTVCESNGIQISMSRKEISIDDSPIKSWHTLQKNFVQQ